MKRLLRHVQQEFEHGMFFADFGILLDELSPAGVITSILTRRSVCFTILRLQRGEMMIHLPKEALTNHRQQGIVFGKISDGLEFVVDSVELGQGNVVGFI